MSSSRRDQRALMYSYASSDADKQREARVLALLAEKKRRREEEADPKSAQQAGASRGHGGPGKEECEHHEVTSKQE